jgi:hypothetical protein
MNPLLWQYVRDPVPPNNGFDAAGSRPVILLTGQYVQQYGYGRSRFVAPLGTGPDRLSLPPLNPVYTRGEPAKVYVVVKPIGAGTPVQMGRAAKAYGQSGGGIQYVLPQSVNALVKKGILRKVTTVGR